MPETCPVVATRGHSLDEVLNGVAELIPARDPRAIADAVLRVLERKEPPPPASRQFDLKQHVESVWSAYRHALRG